MEWKELYDDIMKEFRSCMNENEDLKRKVNVDKYQFLLICSHEKLIF